ncbi:hypothetical protein J437_LFUL014404, partial [Ladona fulva]
MSPKHLQHFLIFAGKSGIYFMMASRIVVAVQSCRKEFIFGFARNYSSSSGNTKRGLVLGVYSEGDKKGNFDLTPAGANFDQKTGGKLVSQLL